MEENNYDSTTEEDNSTYEDDADRAFSTALGIILNQHNGDQPEEKFLREIEAGLITIFHNIKGNPKTGTMTRAARDQIKAATVRMHQAASRMHSLLKEIREKQTETPKETYASILTKEPQNNIPMSRTTKIVGKTIKKGKITAKGNQDLLINIKDEEDFPSLNNETIENTIKKEIQPGKLGIAVSGVYKTKQGICIKVGNKEQGQKLKREIEKTSQLRGKIEVKLPDKKSPKLILLNVPEYIKNEEIVEGMYYQNSHINEAITEENFKEDTKIQGSFKTSRTGNSKRHIILTVLPRSRNIILLKQNLSISWAHVKVDDYLPVIRCYQCCGFGHMSKNCERAQRCSHCAGKHRYNQCKKLEEEPTCTNCREANRGIPEEQRWEENHNAFAWFCPILKRNKVSTINKTEYC